MHAFSIMIVDDDQTIREGIIAALESTYAIRSFGSAEDALGALTSSGKVDLILLDIGLPGMNGLEALREIKKHHPGILVIMITAFEEVASVVTAMKLGAYDYLLKPLRLEYLEITVANALNTLRLSKEVEKLQEKFLNDYSPCFVGESKEFLSVMEFVHKVAQSPDTPVLILGETGTGKEIIAQTIHYRSPHARGPLVTVNCASIPRGLIESELFGYEKGAFTNARSSGKKGLLEEAAGGTIFLDEVGDLHLEAQAKLLRFLESGEYYRIGGTKVKKIVTRVISATNRDLEKMITEERFREDLYYRLGVVKVKMPSLRERGEDIMHLANYFLAEFGRKFGKPFTGFTSEAGNALLRHPWQGNIRELKNIVERGALMAEAPEVTAKDLGLAEKPVTTAAHGDGGRLFLDDGGVDLPAVLDDFEKTYITEAMRIAGGNESRAARLLGLNHHTFRYRRKKLGIVQEVV